MPGIFTQNSVKYEIRSFKEKKIVGYDVTLSQTNNVGHNWYTSIVVHSMLEVDGKCKKYTNNVRSVKTFTSIAWSVFIEVIKNVGRH